MFCPPLVCRAHRMCQVEALQSKLQYCTVVHCTVLCCLCSLRGRFCVFSFHGALCMFQVEALRSKLLYGSDGEGEDTGAWQGGEGSGKARREGGGRGGGEVPTTLVPSGARGGAEGGEWEVERESHNYLLPLPNFASDPALGLSPPSPSPSPAALTPGQRSPALVAASGAPEPTPQGVPSTAGAQQTAHARAGALQVALTAGAEVSATAGVVKEGVDVVPELSAEARAASVWLQTKAREIRSSPPASAATGAPTNRAARLARGNGDVAHAAAEAHSAAAVADAAPASAAPELSTEAQAAASWLKSVSARVKGRRGRSEAGGNLSSKGKGEGEGQGLVPPMTEQQIKVRTGRNAVPFST